MIYLQGTWHRDLLFKIHAGLRGEGIRRFPILHGHFVRLDLKTLLDFAPRVWGPFVGKYVAPSPPADDVNNAENPENAAGSEASARQTTVLEAGRAAEPLYVSVLRRPESRLISSMLQRRLKKVMPLRTHIVAALQGGERASTERREKSWSEKVRREVEEREYDDGHGSLSDREAGSSTTVTAVEDSRDRVDTTTTTTTETDSPTGVDPSSSHDEDAKDPVLAQLISVLTHGTRHRKYCIPPLLDEKDWPQFEPVHSGSSFEETAGEAVDSSEEAVDSDGMPPNPHCQAYDDLDPVTLQDLGENYLARVLPLIAERQEESVALLEYFADAALDVSAEEEGLVWPDGGPQNVDVVDHEDKGGAPRRRNGSSRIPSSRRSPFLDDAARRSRSIFTAPGAHNWTPAIRRLLYKNTHLNMQL